MTSAERADLHILILQFLRAKLEIGATEEGLKNLLRKQAVDITVPQLQVELRALADKAWLAPWDVDILGRRWRITPLGESKLAEAGL